MNLQHTPNPDAQLPSAVPPLSLHSVDVRQLPLIVSSDMITHCRLGNVTTVKREKDFGLGSRMFVGEEVTVARRQLRTRNNLSVLHFADEWVNSSMLLSSIFEISSKPSHLRRNLKLGHWSRG